MDKATYTMHRAGATRGAVSGRRLAWSHGDTIEAPEGEFDHLPDSMYSTRVMRATDSEPEPTADDYEARVAEYHTGQGWYDVPGVEKSLRKAEAIEALKEAE